MSRFRVEAFLDSTELSYAKHPINVSFIVEAPHKIAAKDRAELALHEITKTSGKVERVYETIK